ncbi:23113_t:CDS:1 [Cetraspora pellucida]|uniref:23113_t:CDS:1 n=1 Tax=Cetraspora pellucida TaxID=1433469 RepID=A0A9N8VFI3_9GLOM|nr:23113_t:CDS:1 [Cetraspora pellucida]
MFTPAADVYSLGVIMTEISTGKQAFEGVEFIHGTPNCYVKLAKRCMDSNPKKRPTAKSLNHQVGFWIEEMFSLDDDNEVKKQFLESDNEVKKQFLESDNSLQVINTNKNLSPMSKPIDTVDVLE